MNNDFMNNVEFSRRNNYNYVNSRGDLGKPT